jgi:putative ABC transport system permease protein
MSFRPTNGSAIRTNASAISRSLPGSNLTSPWTGLARKWRRWPQRSSTPIRLRSALVVVEIALALVLLVGAALFIGSFLSVVSVDPGFDSSNLLVAQVSPRLESRTRLRNVSPALVDIVDRAGQIPGVLSAAAVWTGVPLGGTITKTTVSIPGRDLSELNPNGAGIVTRHVTTDYHRVLRVPLRAGRLFDLHDRNSASSVVIINEAAAHLYFDRADPIGRIIGIDGNRTIVGVVGDVHQVSLETDPLPEAFIPLEQSEVFGGDLVIRTSGNPNEVLPALKRAAFAVLPDVPLRNVRTIERLMATRIAQRKVSMLLLGLFGLLGLVIAAVGLYGLMAYLVTQRTREIGVRMALGATRLDVVAMVLRNAGMLVGAGLAIGSVASWYFSTTARTFLFRLQPADPSAFAAAAIVLSVVAFIAALVAARRAASVDPIVALRSE